MNDDPRTVSRLYSGVTDRVGNTPPPPDTGGRITTAAGASAADPPAPVVVVWARHLSRRPAPQLAADVEGIEGGQGCNDAARSRVGDLTVSN